MYRPVDHPTRVCLWCEEVFKPRTSHQNFCDKNCYRKWGKKNKGHSQGRPKRSPYLKHRKMVCEECGFTPEHPCQLDVHHVDGNHYNNEVSNLKTLCANCHRLETARQFSWSCL